MLNKRFILNDDTMMTKRELLENLAKYSDDAIISIDMHPSYRISVNEPIPVPVELLDKAPVEDTE